jgi:hypothetical protein
MFRQNAEYFKGVFKKNHNPNPKPTLNYILCSKNPQFPEENPQNPPQNHTFQKKVNK